MLESANLRVVNNENVEPWTRDELLSHAREAHCILAFMTDCCDRELLDACPKLELVACALKGFDNFDIQLCAERNVAVTAVPDLLTAPTAELAIMLALGLGRRIREADDCVRSGSFWGWRPTLYGSGLADATVGIYGYGALGQAVADRVKGFAPNGILYSDSASLDINSKDEMIGSVGSLDELLEECDILFVCAPLNKSTYQSINQESLKKARPGLNLINISRGSCVDEAAVADALETNQLGGYAADVFEFEDWILKDRPDSVEKRLLSNPRTLFSPHLGSAVTSTRRAIERSAADEIIRWTRGEPYHYRVN